MREQREGRHPRGMGPRRARLHPDLERELFSAERLAARVGEVGRALAAELAGKRPLLLGVLRGCFVFVADLARSLEPVPEGTEVGFLRASSYGAGTESSGRVRVDAGGPDVRGRHVVLVEDIVDTGRTLAAVVARLRAEGAASVTTCTLLDKTARRVVDVHMDHSCFACPDEFVVGYGLDFDERYRTLPYVGVLKPEAYSVGRANT